MKAFQRRNYPIEFRQNFKLQSAMEYLMTYGWAILIIAVVLAALFQLGVFNPMTFAPKASPGSCQIVRPEGAGTTNFISLEGECNGEIPQYVEQMGYVNIGNPQILQIPPGESITISAWIKTSCGGSSAILGHGMQSYIFAVNPESLCTLVFEWWGNSTNIQGTWGGPSIPKNEWVYVVGINNVGKNFTMYVNGTYKFEQNWGLTYSYTNNTYIGGNPDPLYPPFDGSMANIQIYNTALSANDIEVLYKEGIGGAPIKIQNLVAWYPLNGNANDYSGNWNNGVANGVTYTSNWYSGYTAP
ncbi:MAG: LamG domain-containing protein [Candidatus Micrarchaeia archaeon]